jgi:hypothetical protein
MEKSLFVEESSGRKKQAFKKNRNIILFSTYLILFQTKFLL